MQLNKHHALQLYTEQLRKEIQFPGWRREETSRVIRQVSLTNESGFVIFSNLNDENVEGAINEELEYFRSIDQSFEWKVYDYDLPLDLKDRLQHHGFKLEDSEALMVLDLNQADSLLKYPLPEGLRLIKTHSEIDQIMALEDEVWKTSHTELGERLKLELASGNDPLLIYAIYQNEKPVSTAWMFLHNGTSFGSLFGGSTLPEYRKKGYYTALLAIRVQSAREAGFRYVTVDASPMSKPILEKHGFHCLAYSTPCMSPEK